MNDDGFSIQLLSENEILPVPHPAECHVSDFVPNAILLASSTCKSQMQVATAKFHSAGPLARRTAHCAAYCNFIVGSVINRGFQSRKTFGLPAQIDCSADKNAPVSVVCYFRIADVARQAKIFSHSTPGARPLFSMCVINPGVGTQSVRRVPKRICRQA